MTPLEICSLRLVKGKSKSKGFTLSSSVRRAVFRVGSARECNWRVYGEGVQKHHFMLLWNGHSLTVIDVGATDLRVNGEAVSLCKTLRSGRVDFGSAAIAVDQCSHDVAPGKLRPGRQPVPHQSTQDGTTQPREECSLIAKSKIEEYT